MTEYLKIVFQNLEPVRIADDSTSQSGQTVTLRYIPGTALRGIVINALAVEEDFEEIKRRLFSPRVRFLNAYPSDGELELVPAPKGFYEDKKEQQGRKKIDNVVVDGVFEEGKKRAALGRFCHMEGDTLSCYTVETGSDLKITVNDTKQNVFRHEYICAGYIFTGFIALEDGALKERIRRVFEEDFVVGNARSAGLGKCRVLCCEDADRMPCEEYLPAESQDNECYMLLLSHTVMRGPDGELCGLDFHALEEKMGVKDLETAFCSTATVDVRGYNRKWGTKIPSAVMYEQGSVFHLKYQGTLTREKMLALCDQGIGIRRNEGFGRVLFLSGYENVKYKQKADFDRQVDPAGRTPVGRHMDDTSKMRYAEDQETLRIAAGCYYRNLLERKMSAYIVEHPLPKGRIAGSRLGLLESYATAYKYEPREAKRLIDNYLNHALDKEENNSVQKAKESIALLQKYVTHVFDTELESLLSVSTKQKDSVMGVAKADLLTEEEALRWKLELITRMIRYDNKKEEA